MNALSRIKELGTAPSDKEFLAARNVLMMEILRKNGQRTGAIRNLTCFEVNQMRDVGCRYIINVMEHKTRSKFVCQLILENELCANMKTYSTGRKHLLDLRDAHISQDQQRPFFCDCRGENLFSNKLARISRTAVVGTVTDMRKAQYHLVS
jgi:site-specific recombinase XerD